MIVAIIATTSAVALGLALNASRAQVRGLAKELNRTAYRLSKTEQLLWDSQSEVKAEKDKAKTWEGRGTSAERDLRAALDQLFTLTEANARRRESARIRKANWRAKRKANNV